MKKQQQPIIKLDERQASVLCITEYLEVGPGKYKPLVKYDITDQLNAILDQVYKKALTHASNGIAMTRRTHIICLCGSTRYTQQMLAVRWEFEKQGTMVLSWNYVPGAGKESRLAEEEGVKQTLDDLHFRKIEISDLVYVINIDGYVGESTTNEIKYALKLNKPVQFLYPDLNNISDFKDTPNIFSKEDNFIF